MAMHRRFSAIAFGSLGQESREETARMERIREQTHAHLLGWAASDLDLIELLPDQRRAVMKVVERLVCTIACQQRDAARESRDFDAFAKALGFE